MVSSRPKIYISLFMCPRNNCSAPQCIAWPIIKSATKHEAGEWDMTSCYKCCSGVHFINNCSIVVQIWWKFYFNVTPLHDIARKFSLCHHRTAVMTCAKLLRDHFIATKWNLQNIWIVMRALLVKRPLVSFSKEPLFCAENITKCTVVMNC